MDLLSRLHRRFRSRFFIGWWVVCIAALAISTGPGPFAFASMGLFMGSFQEEFGWDRAEVSSALTLLIFLTAFMVPFVGRVVDRFGSRTILLSSMLVMGLSLAAIPTVVTKIWHLYIVCIIIGTLGAGCNSVPHMRALSAWFVKKRGLALGIAQSGIGLGYAYVPLVVLLMMHFFTWRAAWLALAGIILFIAWPLIFLFLRDSPADIGAMPDGDESGEFPRNASRSVGLSIRQILNRSEFWMMVFIFIVLSFVLNGVIPHIVPMLSDRGMSFTMAAFVASTIGGSVFVGRILVGFLIDKLFAPYVAVFFFGLSAVGIGILALSLPGPWAFIAAVMIGLSLGAEVDLLAYLTGRYFGLKYFGTIYGVFFATTLLGTALGPLVFGIAYEMTGSYAGILGLCVLLNILVMGVTALLRRYPDWESIPEVVTA